MGSLGLGARAATAGRRLRGSRGGSEGGGTWPRGWLLKLVPFFLRTWTLLRLSRGNSDSLSAYLRPPPSLRPPPPFPSLETLWDTSEPSVDTDVGRVCRSGDCGPAGEGTGAGRSKQELSSPASPCALRAGRVEGPRGQGGGRGGESKDPTAWRSRRPPSLALFSPPPPPSAHPPPYLFSPLWGVCAHSFSSHALLAPGEGERGIVSAEG